MFAPFHIYIYIYIYIYFKKKKNGHIRIINLFPSCYMFTVECFFFFCPDGITPNSGLTGPNNTIYIYIYMVKFKVWLVLHLPFLLVQRVTTIIRFIMDSPVTVFYIICI